MYLPGDVMQETLLNLLLRNYLHYNLYDQAEKLRSKAPRFEAHSNQQVFSYFMCQGIFLSDERSFHLLYWLLQSEDCLRRSSCVNFLDDSTWVFLSGLINCC